MGSSTMTKDRQIVLMLILRKRRAMGLYLQHINSKEDAPMADYLYGNYIEAHNAAELARRILYGHEL